MTQVIYLDIGSIHNEILRRHPEIKQSAGYLGRGTCDPWATISDTTGCPDGVEIEIDHYDKEDYFGFTVEIARWRPKAVKEQRPQA